MIRLLIPLVVGLFAAGLHFVVVSRKIPEGKFTRITKPIKAGQKINAEALQAFTLMASESELQQISGSLVAWKFRGNAFNVISPRDFNPGDPLLWRDLLASQAGIGKNAIPISLENTPVPLELLRVGQEVMFVLKTDLPASQRDKAEPVNPIETIGPFRIISVGDDVEIRFEKEQSNNRSMQRIISIEVELNNKGQFIDPRMNKLMETQSTNYVPGQPRIVDVVILPGSRIPDTAKDNIEKMKEKVTK